MESIPANPILKFNTDQLVSIRKQYNFENPDDLNRAIDVLEDWIKEQKHFMKKDLPRSYLERMILNCKGSLERAKSKLDKIYTLRTVMPNFFGVHLTENRFQDLDMFKSAILPIPTEQNNRIYLVKATGSKFTFDTYLNYYRYLVLIYEYFMAHDYSDGLIIIIDYSEVSITEVIKAQNLTDLRQIAAIITEGFAMRLKAVHFVTPSKTIDILISMIKQLISSKLQKRFFVHKDFSTLYQQIPKDLFPIDYGGKEKSLAEISDELMCEITGKDFMNYIKEMNEAKTDESCRPRDTFNEHYLGMPGSFRTLSVD